MRRTRVTVISATTLDNSFLTATPPTPCPVAPRPMVFSANGIGMGPEGQTEHGWTGFDAGASQDPATLVELKVASSRSDHPDA